jgi:transcriptional regulator with XRE-family HTH domain
MNEFGLRLRQERERKRISIDSIAAGTKIKASVFEQLERGDTSRWPPGIFRRSYLRAYATAVGLDPDATIREFLAVFPDPADRLDSTFVNTPQSSTELRLHLAGGGGIPAERWRALCCDGVVLSGAGLCGFFLVGSLWAPLAIAACLYHLTGTIFTGGAPGLFLQTWWRRRQLRNASHLSSTTPQSPEPIPGAPEQGHRLSPELSLR